MSERRVNARFLFAALLAANALVFTYQLFTPGSDADAGARIEELQINPGRIRIQGVATRGPGSGTASARSGEYRACLEWGPFAAGESGKAETALAKLALAQPPLHRPSSGGGGAKRLSFYLREPDAATVAQIAELQRAFPATEIKAGPCPS